MQMSLWGATVITNLLSAIPWLGKSLVESINAKELFWIFIINFIINTYLEKRTKLNTFNIKFQINRKIGLDKSIYNLFSVSYKGNKQK